MDRAGNCYVMGCFDGIATFWRGEDNEITLTSNSGTYDIFIAVYDSSGILFGVRQAGG